MSVNVMIRTSVKDLNLEEILRKIVGYDHDLTVVELEGRSVTFFMNKISTRTILIKGMEKGYEIKVPTLASRRDLILFKDTVDVMIKALEAPAYLEDNSKKKIEDAQKYFSPRWILNIMTTDYHIQTSFAFAGEETCIACPIRPFYIGGRLLHDLEIDESTPIEEGRKLLIERMRYSQYAVPFDIIATPLSIFTKAQENPKKQYHFTIYSKNSYGMISGADYFALKAPNCTNGNEKMRMMKYDDFIKIAPYLWERFDNRQYFTSDLTDEEYDDFWNRSLKYNIIEFTK